MKKVDKTVIKETKFVAMWVIIFSALMQAVFLIINKWDYTVLLGNLLSGFCGVLSFFVLGLTIIKAISSGDTAYAKKMMRASQALRTFLMLAACLAGALAPCFNIWATVIPVMFPRLSLLIRSFTVKQMGPFDTSAAETAHATEITEAEPTDDKKEVDRVE
ncbi:MAG: hypothetical protein IJX51_01515 [Clostridia bacterium]|nr:hypothetical protein [Clostridia bacterium]